VKCELRVGLALCEKRIAQINETCSLTWSLKELPFSDIPERRRLLGGLARLVVPLRKGTSDYKELLPAEIIPDQDQIRPVLTDFCVGCTVCEVVCPHNVFSRDETEQGVCYHLVEQRCTGCRKCMDSCLFQGVTLENSLQRGIRRVELGRQKCHDCDEEFIGHAGICPRCRMKETRGLFSASGSSGFDLGVRKEDKSVA
jgi:Fe-S-cluster-containing hydrogenase component 2